MSNYHTYPTTRADEQRIMSAIDIAIAYPAPGVAEWMRAHSRRNFRPLPLPKGAAWPGTSKRPIAKVFAEAVADAARMGWPGSYSANILDRGRLA